MGSTTELLTKRREVRNEPAQISRLQALIPLGDLSSQTSAGTVTPSCASNSGTCTGINFLTKMPEGPTKDNVLLVQLFTSREELAALQP